MKNIMDPIEAVIKPPDLDNKDDDNFLKVANDTAEEVGKINTTISNTILNIKTAFGDTAGKYAGRFIGFGTLAVLLGVIVKDLFKKPLYRYIFSKIKAREEIEAKIKRQMAKLINEKDPRKKTIKMLKYLKRLYILEKNKYKDEAKILEREGDMWQIEKHNLLYKKKFAILRKEIQKYAGLLK